eukprot:TRINITY_DN14522_c0_g1_i1.p2 TRINITY_DN14522_c0_g1~~TRINITY_DN14522_c0_g1_i1.p2  ORF type:complete len:274 (+),score=72.48 TRINITY_DN14522_c0_g1_i1:134-955(+)
MSRQVILSSDIYAPQPVYSHAIKQGSTVYVSGVLGLDKDGKLASGFQEQAQLALNNLSSILIAAGASTTSVVKATVLLSDIKNYEALNQAYGAVFTSDAPARTCYAVSALPKGALVEIEAIAVVARERKPKQPKEPKAATATAPAKAAPAQPVDDGTSIFVGNASDVSEETIKSTFSKYGNITDLQHRKGTAFFYIRFNSVAEAQAAVAANGAVQVGDLVLTIEPRKPRAARKPAAPRAPKAASDEQSGSDADKPARRRRRGPKTEKAPAATQ